MHGSDNLCYKQAQAVYDQVCTRYVVNSSRLRLQSTAPKAVGIVNLLLKFSKTITDINLKQVTVQQQMKEIHFWRQNASVLKHLNAFEPALAVPLEHSLCQITQRL